MWLLNPFRRKRRLNVWPVLTEEGTSPSGLPVETASVATLEYNASDLFWSDADNSENELWIFQQSNQIADVIVVQESPQADVWDWSESGQELDSALFSSGVVSDVVVVVDDRFNDVWNWTADENDDTSIFNTQSVGADAVVVVDQSTAESWPYWDVQDNADSLLLYQSGALIANAVVAVGVPAKDGWNWFESADSDSNLDIAPYLSGIVLDFWSVVPCGVNSYVDIACLTSSYSNIACLTPSYTPLSCTTTPFVNATCETNLWTELN